MNNQLSTSNVLKIWLNDKHGNGVYLTDKEVIVVFNSGLRTDTIIDYGTNNNDGSPRWAGDYLCTNAEHEAISKAVLLLRNIKETDQILSDYKNDYKQHSLISDPLWHHDQGLLQTATGYGSKLSTQYKTFYNNRLYRVYCHCFSNSGSTYIIVKGDRIFLS